MSGALQEAENLIQSLIGKRDTAQLHSLFGTIAASRKNEKEAAAEYQVAAQMDPLEDNVFAFGTSLMKVNFAAASSVLRYGLKTFPKSVRMHVALALSLYAQDEPEEGAELLCQAANLDPSDVHPMEVLADTQVVPLSSQVEAERHLADLHERYPKDGLLLFDYTMVRSGRWSGKKDSSSPELARSLRDAVALDPHLAKAYFELSTLADSAKDYSGDISDLNHAIALSPGAEQYHFRLAFAYRQAGDSVHFHEEFSRSQALHRSISGER